jgi:hypothetical protein
MALTSASAVHAARGPSPLTVMLIVGHGAGVSGEPRPGRPDAAGTQGHLLDGRLPTGCLETRGDPGQAEGCQPRQHPASQASAGGQAPGTSRRSPPVRSRSPGRSKVRLPSMSAPSHAVTLSDTRRHGERAHCRLYTSAMWRRRYRLVQTWAICTPAQFSGDGPSRVMPMVIGVSRHVAKRSRAGQRVLNAWPGLDPLPKPCKRLPSTGSPPP